MSIFFRIFELAIYLFLPLLIIASLKMSLLKSFMLAGRCFFGFVLSLWLFSPFARLADLIVDVSIPNLNALMFFLIWVAVWFLLPFVTFRIAKPLQKTIESPIIWDKVGKVICGAVAGWFAVNGFMAFLVMFPGIEGAYFANESEPLFGRDRRSDQLYSNLTFTTPDRLLLYAQKEAAAKWVFRKAKEDELEDVKINVEELAGYFDERYATPWAPPERRRRRRELRDEIENLLRNLNHVPEAG